MALRGLVMSVLALGSLAAGIACAQTAPPASPVSGSTAPGTAAPTAAPKVQLAAEITLGIGSLVDGIEPHSTASQATSIPLEQAFDGLTGLNARGEMIPALAESWRPVNPTTWEFKLRPNVRFHDGTTMAASDVKFTLDRILDASQALTITSRMQTISGAQVIDPSTIHIVTRAPDPLLPARMNLAKVIPERQFRQMGTEAFVRAPIGTGAWKVREVRQGSFIAFEAFPESWRGAPAMPAARIVKVPEASTLAAASKTGEVDIAYQLPPDAERDVIAGGQVDIQIIERLSTIIIDLNWFPNSGGNPLFADRRLRQALNFAVDKEAVNRAVEGGYAKLAQGQIVTRGTPGFNPELQPYPFDLARARVLMAEAGQTAGFRSTILATPGVNAQTSLAIAGFLRPLNIEISIEQAELPVYLQRYNSGNRGPMFHWGVGFGNFIDADQALSFFMSDQAQTIRRLENPEFDRLMRESKTELDAARRNRLMQQASAVLRDEAPFILMYHQGVLLGVNKKVKNFELRLDNGISFDKLTRER